jgi:multisubunit Na+/H+ antiporter MnhE subunit
MLIGFCSLGYALYLRYLAIEQSSVGLACDAGLATWLCATRKTAIALFTYSVFGGTAVAAAVLHLLRPSIVLFALALAAAGFGIVLYNVALSALAVALLVLSLARRAPEPE